MVCFIGVKYCVCGTSGRVSLQCTARRCVRRPIACFTRLYPTLELMFDESSNTGVDVTGLHVSSQTNSKLTANCALFIDSTVFVFVPKFFNVQFSLYS